MVTLKNLLQTIETTPVSIGFLKKRVPDTVAVFSYRQLSGKHRSELFKGKTALIILVPKKNSPKGHFICLIPRSGHIEYFSSLGRSMESEFAELGEPLGLFRELLGKDYIYNRVVLQSGKYNINSCGAWVLCRVKLAHLKLREFQQMFRKHYLHNPDEIAATLVLLDFVSKT